MPIAARPDQAGAHAVHAIIGTAGHIDHGKSALVKALTGIEPDRLPEERERGISIELGFAYLDLPGIGRAGVVDVPGHERFIRQMLAGAHGFDLVLVVVAADDGVMPQTEEHFDIVHLLGIERAIFVVSKIDAVSAERVEEVRGEIEILAAGTSFETSPVVAVSARTGEGIDILTARIDSALRDLPRRSEQAALRIPIDRVFVMKGHGVVVTGTALAGSIAAGDEVRILPDRPDRPSRRSARVREIQVHGATVERAGAGQRVALNLSGLDKDDVARGETVAHLGSEAGTLRLDARVEIRPAAGKPLRSHTRVRVHHGTRETLARLVWLDGVEEVAPRTSAYAQLALEEPLVAAAGDRFVIRDETARRTLGGGTVLLAQAQRHRRSQGQVAPALASLEADDDAERLRTVLAMSPAFAMEPAEALAAAGVPTASLQALARAGGRIVALPDPGAPQILVEAARLDAYLERTRAAVAAFHAASPDLPGIDVEHLRGMLVPLLDAKVFRLLLDRMIASGELGRRGNLVHAVGHSASLSGSDDALAKRVLERLAGGDVMPPTLKDLSVELGIDAARLAKICGVLVVRGELVKISADLYFARTVIERIRSRLCEHLSEKKEITAAAFRDLIAASRKYCIPLLDWFDQTGVTIRVGDVRRLRRA